MLTKIRLFLESKASEWLLALLFLLPLLFINTRNSQNWGDDFSVYVQQAINISEGKNFDKSGFVYKEGFTPIPPSAPAGFSLALVPVYRFFGFNMLAFSFYQSFLCIIWALVSFYFFRKYFNLSASLALLILAFYSNFILWLKLLLTSDILFSILFLLIALLLNARKNYSIKNAVAAGLLCSFAIFTRSVGWIVIPAVWLYAICFFMVSYSDSKLHIKPGFKYVLIFTPIVLIGYYILNFWLFRSSFAFVQNASNLIDWKKIPVVFATNLVHYVRNYLSLFESTNHSLTIFSVVISYFLMAATLIGIVSKLKEKPEPGDFLFVCYVLFIFSFPVISDYRYIVPVHAFLMVYLFGGLKVMAIKVKVKSSPSVALMLTAVTLIMYSDHLKYLLKHGHETVSGPYEEIAQQTFSYIRKNIANNELIVFNKPRALALYTGKQTTLPNWDKSVTENYNQLKNMGAKYYLLSKEINDDEYNALIEQKKTGFVEVYSNWQFVLYKDITVVN